MPDPIFEKRAMRVAGDQGAGTIIFFNSGLQFYRDFPRWKRGVDLFGSIIFILAFSPIMLVVALMVKLTSDGPVFFRQKRAGLCGKPFEFYKFRSMYIDAEVRKRELMKFNERSGPVFKMTDDPRVTPVGRFIRKWSFDELPQLFNVLKGDISLVGPRPLPVEESYHCDWWQRTRLDVKPGITCLWQVRSRHVSSFDEWARLDIEYITKQSFWFDLKILFMTVSAVFSHRGAK